MLEITTTIKNEGTLAMLGRIGTAKMTPALDAIGLYLASLTKDNIVGHTGPQGAWPRSGLSELYAGSRTWADIASSVSHTVTSDGMGVKFGPSHIAAAVRNFGTVGAGGTQPDIVPVRKKALTIPVSDSASKASYQGIEARTAFPGGFIIKSSHAANPYQVGIVVRKVGGAGGAPKKLRKNKSGKTPVSQRITADGQQVEILYLLVKKTAIRPHVFMPLDAQGNLAPASTWTGIDQMLADAFLGQTEGQS